MCHYIHSLHIEQKPKDIRRFKGIQGWRLLSVLHLGPSCVALYEAGIAG